MTRSLRWLFALAVVTALVLLAEPQQLLGTLGGMRAGWLAAATAAFAASHLVLAEVLYRTMNGAGLTVSRGLALGAHAESLFIGSLLPGSVGADVAKAVGLVRATGQKTAVGVAIGFQRVVALMVALTALVMSASTADPALVRSVLRLGSRRPLILLMAGVASLLVIWLAVRLVPRTRSFLGECLATLKRLVGWGDGYLVFSVALLQILVLTLNVVGCFWVSRSVGLDLRFGVIAFSVILTYLAVVVPISVSGLGVRESVYVVVLASEGAEPTESLALALVVSFLGIFFALLGGLAYSLDSTGRSRRGHEVS